MLHAFNTVRNGQLVCFLVREGYFRCCDTLWGSLLYGFPGS